MPNLPPIAPVGATTSTADLIARVRDVLAEETQDFFDDTTEILPLLNDACLDIFGDVDALPKSWTGDTVQDQSYLALPVDIARIKVVRVADKVLTEVMVPEYHRLDAATGTPTKYLMVLDSAGAEQIVFWPTPSSALAVQVDYIAYPLTLTALQGPVWHSRFHFLPCLYAAAELLDKDHLPENADRLRMKFEAEKVRYRQWLNERFPRGVFYSSAVPKGEM